MGKISKALRFEILTRDGYRCRYCGAGAAQSVLHIDHVVPRALNGRDDAANLVTACQPCNYGKADRKILALPDGFALTPDKRPHRMEKMRRAKMEMAAPDEHILDCDNIDDLDEIDEDSQLSWVWCTIHKKYEWHSIHLDNVEYGGLIKRSGKEVGW